MSAFHLCRYLKISLVAAVVLFSGQGRTQAIKIDIKIPEPTSQYRFAIEEKEVNNGVAAALGAVRNYDVSGGHCSLVVTSKSCYALTAAHCLRDLLAAQGKVEWQALSGVKDPIRIGTMKPGALPSEIGIGSAMKVKFLKAGQASRYVVDGVEKEMTPNQQRQFRIPQQLDFYNSFRSDGVAAATGVEISVENKKAQVIAIGNGFANRALAPKDFDRPPNPDDPRVGGVMSDPDTYYRFVRDSRALDLADHALLKLSEENCTCVKSGELADSEDVVVVGFSGDALQKSTLLNPTQSVVYGASNVPYAYGDQCYSFGSSAELLTRNLGILGKVVVYTLAGLQHQQSDDIFRSRIKYLKDKIVITNARAAQGASGGAMLNSKGELAGITTQVIPHASGQKTAGVRVSEIKDQMKATLNDTTLNDAFNCD